MRQKVCGWSASAHATGQTSARACSGAAAGGAAHVLCLLLSRRRAEQSSGRAGDPSRGRRTHGERRPSINHRRGARVREDVALRRPRIMR